MRALNLILFTISIVLILGIVIYLPRPSSRAYITCREIEKLLAKKGLHKIYINGIVEFQDNKIVVYIHGEKAETNVHGVVLLNSRGQGTMLIVVNKTYAWIIDL